ncbi:MAG: SpoIIE family protein phosphatase [Candidatus Thermoplasmatota archaeon]
MYYHVVSEKGTKRPENEDSYIIEQNNNYILFAIADGVGGLPEGKKASTTALQTIKNSLQTHTSIDLLSSIEQAHRSILMEGEKQQKQMATTIVACLIDRTSGKALITHVGDSRAYIIDDTIWKTKDHTLVQELVDLGIITEEQALTHPERHRITQALGITPQLHLQLHRKLINDSILLLCSDGLSDFVSDAELAAIARGYEPKEACQKLVEKARKNGSTDDITVLIAHIKNQQKNNFF